MHCILWQQGTVELKLSSLEGMGLFQSLWCRNWYFMTCDCCMFSAVLLQLCLVSILGFILYCITYLPDERTSMQFIVKVGSRFPQNPKSKSPNQSRAKLFKGQKESQSAVKVVMKRVSLRPRHETFFCREHCLTRCKGCAQGAATVREKIILTPFLLKKKKRLYRDPCEWRSAFIKATWSLISRTMYAAGISRQLKSAGHCFLGSGTHCSVCIAGSKTGSKTVLKRVAGWGMLECHCLHILLYSHWWRIYYELFLIKTQ